MFLILFDFCKIRTKMIHRIAFACACFLLHLDHLKFLLRFGLIGHLQSIVGNDTDLCIVKGDLFIIFQVRLFLFFLVYLPLKFFFNIITSWAKVTFYIFINLSRLVDSTSKATFICILLCFCDVRNFFV